MANKTMRYYAADGSAVDVEMVDNGDGTYSMAESLISGGSGGGPVTVADGADVAQGAKADVAYTSGAGSIIALLKGVFARLAGLPAALGAATRANSLPIALATDQTDNSGAAVKASLYGKLSAAGDTPLEINAGGADPTNGLGVGLLLSSGSAWTRAYTGVALGYTAVAAAHSQATLPYIYNNTTFDVPRGNLDVTLLASAARTTTQTSADIVNVNGRFLHVILDMTVIGTGSVTVTINAKDPASGKYFLLLAGAAVVGNSTNVYRVGPGLTAAANATANDALPRTLQIVVTANNANSATYSVGYCLLAA